MVEFKKGDRIIVNNPEGEVDWLQDKTGVITKEYTGSTCEVKFDEPHSKLEYRDADDRRYYDIYPKEMQHLGGDYDLW